jgi:mono/diheme cytochrome c family protein
MTKTMNRFILCVLAINLASFFLVAREPKDAGKSGQAEGPVARLRDAPASARALKNPFAGEAQAIAAGRKLFERHCSTCHGAEGFGAGRAANLHAAAIREAPPGVLFWAISNGRLKKGMPSWSGLPPAELWQLVTYLKSLK